MSVSPRRRVTEFDWLAWRLRGLLVQRRRPAFPGLLSVTLELPLPLVPAIPPLRDGDLFWSHPAGGIRLFGRGPIPVAEAAGPDRLEQMSQRLGRLAGRWVHLDPDGAGCEPPLFVGLAFDGLAPMQGEWAGFPNSALYLPALLLRRQDGVSHLTFSCRDGELDPGRQCGHWLELFQSLLYPDARPPSRGLPAAPAAGGAAPADAEWLALGRRALDAIRGGGLGKLVLCRRVRRHGMAALRREVLVERLERAYPDCRLFAVARGDALLVSASPERLLRKQGREVTCDAVAGTVRRDREPAEDRRLERVLFRSPKLREEQAVVADAIRAALAPVSTGLSPPAVPGVRRLHNLQHLWSEIRATLKQETGLLELVQRLHPTPAVGGTPGSAALAWLRANEPLQRGWYSGAGGWVDRAGDGELAVLLRCALLRGDRADLFAGAGLVAGSDPEGELAETELKLGALTEFLRPS